jgi:hypothetical protein
MGLQISRRCKIDKRDVIVSMEKILQTQLPVRLHLGRLRETSVGNALHFAFLCLLIGVFSVEDSWIRVPGHLPGGKAARSLATRTHIIVQIKERVEL